MCSHWLIFSSYFVFTVFKWYICYSVAVIEHYCCLIIYFIEYYHTHIVNLKSALKYCTVMYSDCTLNITCMCLLMCVCSELYWNRSRKRSVRSPWWCSLIWTGGLECAGPDSRRNRLPLWRATLAATAAPSTTVQYAVQSHIAKNSLLIFQMTIMPQRLEGHVHSRGHETLFQAVIMLTCQYRPKLLKQRASQRPWLKMEMLVCWLFDKQCCHSSHCQRYWLELLYWSLSQTAQY